MTNLSEHAGAGGVAHDTPRTQPPLATIDDQLFHLSLGTILTAHLYGHMTEAHALRAIAKAMRERVFEKSQFFTAD